MGQMRLHRYIGQSGVTSRRKAEEYIRDGRVMVNGETIVDMGISIDPEVDVVFVDGTPVGLPSHQSYLFYKPKNVMTTMSDPQGRKTVKDYFPPSSTELKPVGRLDYQTDGLIVVTNDGELAAQLTHPKWGVEKEYEAVVRGVPSHKSLDKLRKGVWIEGGKTAPAIVELVAGKEGDEQSKVVLVIHEGRKNQVRNMLSSVGHKVLSLRRTRIGPFLLKGLRVGEMRKLGQKEVAQLRKSLG